MLTEVFNLISFGMFVRGFPVDLATVSMPKKTNPTLKIWLAVSEDCCS